MMKKMVRDMGPWTRYSIPSISVGIAAYQYPNVSDGKLNQQKSRLRMSK